MIGYAFSLPLTEDDSLRTAVTIYLNWLTAMLPTSRVLLSVPPPLRDQPLKYFPILLRHFYFLFTPRENICKAILYNLIIFKNHFAVICSQK